MTDVGALVSPLLVGRDDILALADRRVSEALGGRGLLLLIAGEAGVGKTRLMRAVLGKADAAGFRIARGSVAPQDQLVVLAAVQDLARDMTEAAFGTLGPRLLSVDRGLPLDDSHSTRRTLVRDLVQLVAGAIDRPTVLTFDDLQWADEMTLEVIAELARASRELPLMLIGVYRPEALPMGSIHREWRARLLTQRLAEEVQVERLTRDETGLVTTLLLGRGLPAAREVIDAVHMRTNGIPLHIEELLAAVRGHAADGRSILGAHVPDTIEDAVLGHTARLSADGRTVVGAGAVMGRCFTPVVLAGILDRPVADLDEPLDELVNAGILFPFEQVGAGYYDFRHQLLRDAIYDSVAARDLRRFHARAAEFGATLIGANDIHASAHYERAGMRTEAFRVALGAADEAAKVHSMREAFDLYRRAVENLPPTLPDTEQARVWIAYAGAAAALDRNDIFYDAARRARETALRAGDAALAVEALLYLGIVARREGEPLVDRRDGARRAVLEAERLPDSAGRRVRHVETLELLAIVELEALNLTRAREYFEEGRALAARDNLVEDARSAEAYLRVLDLLEGRADGALESLGRSADEARQDGQETLAVNTYCDIAYYAARSMDYRTAALRIVDGLRYAEEVEQSYCGHVLASTQALVSWADGRWDDAARQGGQALSDPGSVRARTMAIWVLGWTALGRGDRLVAERYLADALAVGRRAGSLELILPAQWGLAETALMAGDAATAISRCEEALTEARQGGEWGLLAPFVVTGVRAYETAGQPEAAARWLEQVIRAIGPLAAVASPAIHHGTGLVKLSQGFVVAARESLESAVREWDERGRRWESLWARLDLAAADLRANRYAEAMTLVREVRDAAEALGSRPLLERADALARLSKGRGAELDSWHPLTVREYEVARKITEGLTNAQIADELFVSPKTVSAHVEHILAKLGAARRAEIAAWVATTARV